MTPESAQTAGEPELDRLIAEFDAATATKRPEETPLEPAGPGAADRLAQLQELRDRSDRFVEDTRSKLAEADEVLELEAQRLEVEERQKLVKDIRTRNGLEHVPDQLIENALNCGDEESAKRSLDALQTLEARFQSHAMRSDNERAMLAVRNVSTFPPSSEVEFDAERAANMGEREWEVYKRKIVSQQARR